MHESMNGYANIKNKKGRMYLQRMQRANLKIN